ncbi:molybdenum cofactor biosynthesis protein MoaE [Actinotalea subterranea]|uniref:molybdenum cofactor biosynthesis protein MoaE n=1 Tax=Actinotalea subterranea TaxID=2607497 RepID=UPI00165EA347|nr:molybdenum cofactor biosynthesis protein MoaE [Actinotalea subterranea]
MHPDHDAADPAPTRLVPAAREVARATVTTEALDVAEHARLVGRDAAGAVVTFAGVVRDHDHDVTVSWLEYTAHPGAGTIVTAIAREVASEFAVDAVAVTHRVGRLEIGDCALAVAVSSAHRAEAFAATAELVERVKQRLPVWKRQVFTDGAAEWVNSP